MGTAGSTFPQGAGRKSESKSKSKAQGDPITSFASSVFPGWEPSGLYKVQVMRSGLWREHPEYGDIHITNVDLATAVWNFLEGSGRLFLDHNHAITHGDAGKGEAIGWARDLWIETGDGRRVEPGEAEASDRTDLRLVATYEVNAEANEQIKAKKYAFFSPTWYSNFFNHETGKYQGMTIIGGAATNIPFFQNMDGFEALVAEIEVSGLARLPNSSGSDRRPCSACELLFLERLEEVERRHVAEKQRILTGSVEMANAILERFHPEPSRPVAVSVTPTIDDAPGGAVGEVMKLADELRKKNPSIAPSDAMLLVLQADTALSDRYRRAVVVGS